MRNFDFKRYTPRPKKLLRASLSLGVMEEVFIMTMINATELESKGLSTCLPNTVKEKEKH